MTPRRVPVAIAALLILAGCGQADSAANEQAGDAVAKARTLEEFARGYLVNHVCPDAPTPRKLARRIAQVVRDRPGTTWGAAAMGICNKTRR